MSNTYGAAWELSHLPPFPLAMKVVNALNQTLVIRYLCPALISHTPQSLLLETKFYCFERPAPGLPRELGDAQKGLVSMACRQKRFC